MPVVFDRRYGEKIKLEHVCLLRDETAFIGKGSDARLFLSWLDRVGEVLYSRALTGYTEICRLQPVGESSVLIVGRSTQQKVKSKQVISSARATVIDREGNVHQDFYLGEDGSLFTIGEVIDGGALLLGGSESREDGRCRGILVKASARGALQYKYSSPTGSRCAFFEAVGDATGYVCAAFSPAGDAGEASVVRLDALGHPAYTTPLPAPGLLFTGLRVSVPDGSAIVAGHSASAGGIVYKLRPEGDIIFSKTVIPASPGTRLDHLSVARSGAILAGGNDDSRGYLAILRADGTSLFARSFPGTLTGAFMNGSSGEVTATTFDTTTYRGQFLRVSGAGNLDFERNIDGEFDALKVDNSGEVTLLSRREGRVGTYSSFGELLSGGYISENKSSAYTGSLVATSGEVVFWDADSRVVKLGHGLYISDVKITKPVNGSSTAIFTVTLTGFSTNREGVPLPVTVDYATRPVTATGPDNFTPARGQLSFIPAKGESNRYSIKQNIEIPIKANAFIEGTREFEIVLSGVERGYIVKPVGRGIIEDQQAILKLVRAGNGVEGQQEILYEIGLFKTDGSSLTNATGADVVIEGSYGEGTADALDFDMGLAPRIVIPAGRQTGTFGVKTLEDTRYELSKTVVVNFDRVHALSGTRIALESPVLACVGTVIDQPAMIKITSLGDHRVDNNVVSGFFNLSLHRVSDDALLTNATGDDIVISVSVDAEASAHLGKDFVLTNQHDLRVDGDGSHGTVTLFGVVLYNTDDVDKTVHVAVDQVQAPRGALPLGVAPDGQRATFLIKR